jgi:hypothetical protein
MKKRRPIPNRAPLNGFYTKDRFHVRQKSLANMPVFESTGREVLCSKFDEEITPSGRVT